MGSRRNVKSIIRAHVSPAFRIRGSDESKRAAPVFVTGWRSRESPGRPSRRLSIWLVARVLETWGYF